MELIILTLSYYASYIVIGAFIFYAYAGVTDAIWHSVFGHSFMHNPHKDSIESWSIIILCLFLIFSGPFFVLKYGFTYEPPFLESINASEKSEEKMSDLNIEATRIKESLSQLDDLTIKQIRTELESSLQFIRRLLAETENQEKLVSELKKSVELERMNAEKSRAVAKQINQLSVEQIEAVKQVITENAKDESAKGFWLGVLLSLPIGIAASLLASFLFHKLIELRSG